MFGMMMSVLGHCPTEGEYPRYILMKEHIQNNLKLEYWNGKCRAAEGIRNSDRESEKTLNHSCSDAVKKLGAWTKVDKRVTIGTKRTTIKDQGHVYCIM